ncbi:MAG: hypothetical protein E7658_09865 [Ruminococcaceae bacterium]|nr:hypothetical protein [Oscillospiraceae bacterium]
MKRIIAFLLMAAMLTSLAACGTTPGGEETEASETEAATDPVETRTPSGVPEGTTFDGASYNIGYFVSSANYSYYLNDELTGDNMKDAVYRRARKVESTLDVKLSHEEDDLDPEVYRSLFKAGDDIYQELHFHIISNVADFVTGNLLYNVDTLPYMTLDADWYNYEQMDAMRMGKNTYYIVSDYVIQNPAAIVFNQNMIVDNNLADPYELVKNGTWTMDNMVQMAIDVRNDVNGDGEYTSEDDVYGIAIAEVSLSSPFLAGAGQLIGSRNPETGLYEMTMNNENCYAALDKLYRLYEHPGSVNFNIVDFEYGTTLFYLGFASDVEKSADITEFSMGVVPFPKMDEEQEQYYSKDYSGPMAIPGTIKNPEMVGAVQELLAWESGNEVVDTYYNKLLKTRYATDPDARAMVELIFDTVVYDVLGNYFGFKDGFCGLFYLASYPIHQGMNNYAAFFRPTKGLCKQTLATFYAELEKVEGTAETETAAE